MYEYMECRENVSSTVKFHVSTYGKRRGDIDADKTLELEVVIDSSELGRFRQAPHPIRQVRRRPTYPSHVAQPLALIGHSYLFQHYRSRQAPCVSVLMTLCHVTRWSIGR